MKRKTSSRKKAKSKGKAPPPQLLPTTTTTATTTTTTTQHSHPSSQQRPQSGSARNSLLIPFNSLLEEHKRERSSSVVAFPVGPYKEWVRLPEIKVKGLDNASAKGREEKAQQQPQRQPVLVCGPKDDLSHTLETFQDVAAGQSISTYPSTQGLPICDYFEAQLFERRTLMCLADGCSWGETPRLAARNAVAGFMEYMKQNQHSIFDIREAGRLVLRAFSKAHQKIVEGYEDVWDAGTTTLAAGILLELDTSRTNDMTVLQAMNESLQAKHRGNHLKNIDLWQLGDHLRVAQKGSPHQQPNDEEQWFETETDKEKARNEEDKGEPFRWILVCANVGDCKIYHYDSHTHLYTDLTESSRTSLTDCRDPGGRLGPQEHPLGDPDLRNLGLLFIPCREDDLIIFVSDGVHDNLDPQNLGIMPDQLGLMHKTWLDAEVVEPQMANHYKNLFRSKYICELVKQGGTKLRCRETNAVMVAGELVEHSYEITRNSREFIETQPDGRLPMDYVRYPGKMDHSSCLVVKAGGRTAAGREKNTPHTEHYLRYFPAFASSVKQEQQQQNEPSTSEPTETNNATPSPSSSAHLPPSLLPPDESETLQQDIIARRLDCYTMDGHMVAEIRTSSADRIADIVHAVQLELKEIIEGRPFRLCKANTVWRSRPVPLRKSSFEEIAFEVFSDANDVIVIQFGKEAALFRRASSLSSTTTTTTTAEETKEKATETEEQGGGATSYLRSEAQPVLQTS